MAKDYIEQNSAKISKSLRERKIGFETMYADKMYFESHYGMLLDSDIQFIHTKNSSLGERIPSQYIFHIDNPEPVLNDIDDKIKNLEKDLETLKKSKKHIEDIIIENEGNIKLKRDIKIDNLT